jgi:hypothetical protein
MLATRDVWRTISRCPLLQGLHLPVRKDLHPWIENYFQRQISVEDKLCGLRIERKASVAARPSSVFCILVNLIAVTYFCDGFSNCGLFL